MSVQMKSRNLDIMLLKIFFTFVVVVYHAHKILPKPGYYPIISSKGYLAVDFFFMITGYLMANSIVRNRNNGIEFNALGFILHKAKSLYHHILVAFIISFILWTCFVKDLKFYEILTYLFMSFGELTFLTVSGIPFTTHIFNGPVWYISAMMLSIFLLYPLCYKNVVRFGQYGAPVLSIFLLAFIINVLNLKNINGALDWTMFTTIGVLRATVSICLGISIYSICDKFKKSNMELSAIGNKIFRFFAFCIFCVLLIFIYVPIFKKYGIITDVNFIVYCFLFLTILLITNTNFFWLDNKFINFLSELSLPMYLNHRIWCYLINARYNDMANLHKLILYLVATFITALVALLFAKILVKKKDLIKSLLFKPKKS